MSEPKETRVVRERKKAMEAWQRGEKLGGKRYPKDHPWNDATKPDALEKIVARKQRGNGHPQPKSHPWKRRTFKGEE